jgi:hypothetical protein
MKNAFSFVLACIVLFGSGYFVAKPRNEADKVFAPLLGAIAAYSLWRGRSNPSLPLSNSGS